MTTNIDPVTAGASDRIVEAIVVGGSPPAPRFLRGPGCSYLPAIRWGAVAAGLLISLLGATGFLPEGLGAGMLWALSIFLIAGAFEGCRRRENRAVLKVAEDCARSSAEAFIDLASGTESPLPAGHPLSEAFAEAASQIQARLDGQLQAQKESLEKEFQRQIVKVKSHCERLVEKYAERAQREKEALLSELDGTKLESERETRRRELERQQDEVRLHAAEDSVRELGDKIVDLEADLSARVAENASLSAEVRRLLEELESARSQGLRFFDKVAAQLRGPLQIVGKLASSLDPEQPRDPFRADETAGPLDCAREIGRRVQQVERLVEQVLDLCRLDSGRQSFVFSEIDAGKLVGRCLREVEQEARARGVDLRCEFPDKLSPVVSDSSTLTKILRELLSNAVQYTRRGGRVVVSGRLEPSHAEAEGSHGDSLRIEVSDTGPGIPEEDHERIFVPFERGQDPQFTLADAKPGLGLALSRRHARLLGGNISLRSEMGRGSIFTLEVPVKVLERTPY